jgi:hypothetical protein
MAAGEWRDWWDEMSHEPPTPRQALRCDACGVEGEGRGIGRFRIVEDLDQTPWEDVLCRPMLCNDCVQAILRRMTQGPRWRAEVMRGEASFSEETA